MSKKVKSWSITIFKISFAVALIYWLLRNGRFDFKRLAEVFNGSALVGCTLLAGLSLTLASERWRGLLRARGFQVSFFEGFRFTLIGAFFNFVIPGGVGGDVVKSYYVAKQNPTARLRSVLTIAMDRLLGLFSMLIMALIIMLVDWEMVQSKPQLLSLFQFLSFLFFGFMLGWSFIFSRRLYDSGLAQKVISRLPKKEKLLQLYESFSDYRHHKGLFFQSVLLSFLAQIVAVGFFIFCGRVFGFSDIPLHSYFFVVPVGFMITAIPIAPAGIGIGQMAFYFLFNLVTGVETQVGPLTVSANQIFSFLYGLLGAYFYITSGQRPATSEVQKSADQDSESPAHKQRPTLSQQSQ